MYCKFCGNEIDDNSKFCKYCGGKLDSEEEINIEDRKKREIVYDGELHKCPNCGENLKSFVSVCPSCGYELRWTKNGTNKVQQLLKKISKTRNLSRKNEIISNFYVPNTKEDIIEFFTLAISQIDDNSPCSDAWCSKLDQTLIKAQVTFGDSSDYIYLKKLYNRATKEKKKVDKSCVFVLCKKV